MDKLINEFKESLEFFENLKFKSPNLSKQLDRLKEIYNHFEEQEMIINILNSKYQMLENKYNDDKFLVQLYVLDTENNITHKVGDWDDDFLYVSNGEIRYLNLTNGGETSINKRYQFVDQLNLEDAR